MTFPTEWKKNMFQTTNQWKKGMIPSFLATHRDGFHVLTQGAWNDPFFHSGSLVSQLTAKVMSFFPPSFAELCTNTTQNMKIQCFNSNFPHDDDPTQWLLTEGGQGPFHAQNGPTTRENENESLNFEDMEDVATLEENHLRIWAFRVTKVGIVPWRSYRLIERLIDMQNPWINSDRIWNRQSLRIGCCTYRFIYV